MNSIGEDCFELKKAYDACFNNWFSKQFLQGVTEDPCAPLFRVYQECVKKAIKEKNLILWEPDKKVLDKETEQKVPMNGRDGTCI